MRLQVGRRSVRVALAAPCVVLGIAAAGIVEDLLALPKRLPEPLARDEEFVVRFNGAVPLRKVQAGGITLARAGTTGESGPRGEWVPGRALVDPATGRAVVIRPEALREFFILEKGLERADADVQAAKLIAKIERTGKVSLLAPVDQALRVHLGAASGSRLDDPSVFATYPASQQSVGGSSAYRELIAGSDSLHAAYLAGEFHAFTILAETPGFERFHHPIDPETGNASPSSVLAQRTHRRVLIRRTRNLLTFVPAVPRQADLADSGFAPGTTVNVRVAPSLRSKVKDLLPARGGALKFIDGLARLTTAPDTGNGGTYLGGTPWTGSPSASRPRIVNMTPPDGEFDIDPTTEWEDPDHMYTPVAVRRPFEIHLRFDRPLDPRTVDSAHFKLTWLPDTPVAATVTLVQSRMGEVRVDIRPQTTLSAGGQFEVRVLGAVRSLNGTEMTTGFVAQFATAQ